MHYLITGGCGFIGSHLTDLLLARGHSVTIIDDLSTGKRENIPASVTVKVADITTPGVFDDLVGKADGCFHLAAIVSVQLSNEQWLRTHQVNQMGTVALFDALVKHKRQIPVVFASSAAVYGDCKDIPLKEGAGCKPLSAYGADKYACEFQASVATHIHGIPTAGLRFFNVYGPRQDPASPYSGVISIFASRFKGHQNVSINGDGMQTRDFIYVGDIVSGLFASMQALEQKKVKHGIYNLSTGTQTSVKKLAEIIAGITASRSVVSHTEARAGDIRFSAGDAEAAKHSLGWQADVKLPDGLTQTLKAL